MLVHGVNGALLRASQQLRQELHRPSRRKDRVGLLANRAAAPSSVGTHVAPVQQCVHVGKVEPLEVSPRIEAVDIFLHVRLPLLPQHLGGRGVRPDVNFLHRSVLGQQLRYLHCVGVFSVGTLHRASRIVIEEQFHRRLVQRVDREVYRPLACGQRDVLLGAEADQRFTYPTVAAERRQVQRRRPLTVHLVDVPAHPGEVLHQVSLPLGGGVVHRSLPLEERVGPGLQQQGLHRGRRFHEPLEASQLQRHRVFVPCDDFVTRLRALDDQPRYDDLVFQRLGVLLRRHRRHGHQRRDTQFVATYQRQQKIRDSCLHLGGVVVFGQVFQRVSHPGVDRLRDGLDHLDVAVGGNDAEHTQTRAQMHDPIRFDRHQHLQHRIGQRPALCRHERDGRDVVRRHICQVACR
ncbi:uncharacterized protein BcabD6B2_45730 [Babesia caballi]|uniref:Uncharacterized protein n=1 Tax=Babesia caballi TaxID=5871 RepID=A0AAV4LYT2_BABCB|nr:hypothetical protein BcabD6B2_45730 [Babesia caballi]